ncbi:MAG: glycosyltransferase family 4 protein [Bacteroidetes bacterium]|nr:glycosyltransferase family 4 protein [Bacteroidota bacterium]
MADHLVKQGHEVHFLANAYQGSTIDYVKLEGGREFKYKIYGQKYKPYFEDYISHHLKKTKTDRFIILLDTFMLHGPNGWFLNIDTSPARTYFWYPSDGGGGMPVGCHRILQKVEEPVAMARFGQKQVKDYYNIDTKHIPHGVDSKRFYRLPEEDRNRLKAKYNLSGKFVIGVVARNQPRKHLDKTIKTMYLLKDKIPNAVLFLHMDPNDPAGVFYLPNLISRYNLENRVIFSGMSALEGIPYEQMNEIYNVMDCFFLSTSGEGFGIPIIEAMSCEVPVVMTDYTTCQELVKDNNAGLGVNLSGTETIDLFKITSKDYDLKAMAGTMTGSWEVERGVIDINDAADKIEYLYKNPDKCKEFGNNGRKAVLNKYDQEIVNKQWNDLINN